MATNPPGAVDVSIVAGKVMLTEARKSPTDFAWTLVYRLRQAGITDAELLAVSERIQERHRSCEDEKGLRTITQLGRAIQAAHGSSSPINPGHPRQLIEGATFGSEAHGATQTMAGSHHV